jgi:hypothetical protein
MDKILKTMYLRLDSTAKSLMKNAISQLLIKILYANTKSLSESQILTEYKKVLSKKNTNENQIKENLQILCDDNSIIFHKGQYHLSTNKREKINKSYQESEDRKKQIIENYFKPFFSDETIVSDWLSDATMSFFKLYSNEWISDLCFKKMSAVSNSKENILKTIKEQTLKNKSLNKQDREDLSNKFINFLTTKEIIVDSYLWEYGISSFSAQLISNSNGADEFSIETFRNCKCVLDTNILMNIGLESSDYYSAFKSLEEIFVSLNIEVGILNITRDEYKNTIGSKRDEILKLVGKYPLSVLKETDDQYVKTAIARKCRDADDFSRFFSQLMDTPKYVEKNLKIDLFDDDHNLCNEIDKAQKDEQKLNELNTIFKKITGHDKRQSALFHDVGLIAGVNYLRTKDKYFILSQEISVNTYAKEKPSINDLPISIRLETLINVLAIDNGGIDIDASDYATLFAAIIRKGLIPNRDIFRVTDLSIMLEKNEQIAQLPKDETIRIGNAFHRNRLLGASEENLDLYLRREIQGVKLKIVDDLTDTKAELSLEKSEKKRYKTQADNSIEVLRDSIRDEYKRKIRNNKIGFFLAVPLIFIALGVVGFYFYKNASETTSFIDYLVSIFIEIIINVLFILFASLPKIKNLKKEEETYIDNEIQKRLDKKKNS